MYVYIGVYVSVLYMCIVLGCRHTRIVCLYTPYEPV